MAGFIDLQVNGYQGVDFSRPGLTLSEVRKVVVSLRDRGTVAFCPTVISSALTTYRENLPVLARAFRERDLAPHLLGIHLEGPFISSADGARGAHPREYTVHPDPPLYEELHELCDGLVSLVTVAPELPGIPLLIRQICESGAKVSLGHHCANRRQIEEAADAGAIAVTHLGNGLPNLLPRHPNPIWDQLDEQRLTPMLITDGHHLPDSLVRVLTRLLGADGLVIVSDSAPIAGLPPGNYETLGQGVVLEKDGKLWNPAGEHLVGSSACLLDCLNHLASLEVLTEEELWKVAFHNPLKLLGFRPRKVWSTGTPRVAFRGGEFCAV